MTSFSLNMVLKGRGLTLVFGIFIWLLLNSTSSYGTATDIYCLKTLKESLEDPFNYLNSSWNFDNNTEGFICKFIGIDCWHPNENRVLNIRLSDMGLQGEFPRSVMNCTALTGLDLSGNKLYGTIPGDISEILPFVTSLDLSSNNFSAEIPVSLANCSYLNVLKLDDNQLTGHIPPQLALLSRLRMFNVSNNHLTGPVPNFINNTFTAESYANNAGLCGDPLPPCQASS